MKEPRCEHRLIGLEPDNLLAFLALLGLLRALEAARPEWRPRAAWQVDQAPLRPFLWLCEPTALEHACEAVADGVLQVAETYDFGGRAKLKLSQDEARDVLREAALCGERAKSDMWSALICDAASKPKADAVERTPLCLLDMAQTNFLKNLAEVCRLGALPRQGDPRKHLETAIANALFSTWRREDDTPSFRWDPIEDSRHAYRWTAPTDDKQGVEHGANILAAVGFPIVTVVPSQRNGEIRLQAVGGDISNGGFSFVWPIWREPVSLAGIRTLLTHPDLPKGPAALEHLGVVEVRRARRVSVGKFMNFARAEPVEPAR